MTFVLPLHKDGSSGDLNNCRPISKLPCLAKVLERLVNNQIGSFLSDHAILNVFQSGFRPGHSTVSAAARVLNDIASALDSKQDCAALFIDLTKAFDHSRLLQRLHAIGFDVKSLNWFKNDLTGRCQAIVADGYQSDFICLSKGVPQGSILGPLLFTFCINDFGTNVVNSKIHLYVDDTVIYSAAPSGELALQNLQSDFLIIQQALIDLKLGLTKLYSLRNLLLGSILSAEYKLKGFLATNTWAFRLRINVILKSTLLS